MKQYEFPVKAVSEPNKKLSELFCQKKKRLKHVSCDACTRLPDNYNCNDRFLVYEFTCNFCHRSYIGETCRPFVQRLKEHSRSLSARDKKSALTEHLSADHPQATYDLDNFQLEVLA